MCIVFTEVLKEDRNLKADRPLQVALTVSSAEEVASDVVMVADPRSLFFFLLELVPTELAALSVLELHLLAYGNLFHFQISL